VLVVLIVVWSLYELYPPQNRDLIEYFRTRAVNTQDPAFKAIVQRAQHLEKVSPQQPYDDLVQAVGTNDLTKYFPFFDAKNEVHPTTYILNHLQREAAGKIRLGLDLQGGTSFLVSMDTSSLTNASEQSSALSQAVEVLRKRVDRFGVAEPLIQPQGRNQILVQLPGLSASDQEKARVAILRAAFLQFKLVAENSDQLLQEGVTPPGYEVLSHVRVLPNGKRQLERYVVKKRPEMTGGIKSAIVVRDPIGQPEINFTLDSAHADLFGKITRENVQRKLAVILDGELQTAPVIKSPIEDGSGVIQGDYTEQEAFQLKTVLENPLRAPLKIDAMRKVDPTLGRDSIRSGVRAAIYGTIAVSGFMLVYYLVAGLIANVALLANIIILLGVMCSIPATLTLPGIAGIVLTIGMAVDANVLIYERIREELAKGKSLRGAIAAGYGRAFGTIFDSNLTTLISSVILIFLGTGPIKGFGVALTIGVLASLFTSLVITRLIFDWLLDRGWLKSVPMLHIIRASKLDFMKLAKGAFITSWLIIGIGMGYGVYRGKSAFGRDFVGGTSTTFTFAHKEADVDRLRTALNSAGIKDALIQYQKNLSTGLETLRVDSATDTGDTVKQVLTKQFPEDKFEVSGQDSVGATVGKDIRNSAIIATLLSLFGILVYVAFRYEFSFAVGAVLAIIHDVLMTAGIYYLSGKQFNSTTVAAFLTIIGFSINDTIVIFDRIREDLKLGVRGTFKEVMNQALNQTLSRTIITSGTVFLATLSLYIFGGGEINDFAFAFLVGIITGTYSSIYIASALVLWWHKGQRPALGAAPLPAQTAAAPVRG
jgi:SecD/SecF fusion protein